MDNYDKLFLLLEDLDNLTNDIIYDIEEFAKKYNKVRQLVNKIEDRNTREDIVDYFNSLLDKLASTHDILDESLISEKVQDIIQDNQQL